MARIGFPSTHWSVVAAAGRGSDVERAALSELCRAYWAPLRAYALGIGLPAAEAEDLVQGFIAAFIESDSVRRADASRGRFRSYLLGALKHHLSRTRQRAVAAKRGGRHEVVSLEATGGLVASRTDDPESAYDRKWAEVLLARVREQLRTEYADRSLATRYDALEPHLVEPRPPTHADTARRLGLTEGATKVALHRLRRRFGELLRGEIEATVCHEADVDEELHLLLGAVSAPASISA